MNRAIIYRDATLLRSRSIIKVAGSTREVVRTRVVIIQTIEMVEVLHKPVDRDAGLAYHNLRGMVPVITS